MKGYEIPGKFVATKFSTNPYYAAKFSTNPCYKDL